MKLTHLAVTAATALAVVAGATGCGKDDTDHSAHATPSAAATSATAASAGQPAAPIRTADPNRQPAPIQVTPTADPTNPVADVNCGPVTDAGGGTRTVIAVGSATGRVGCTEAINVATTYATTVSNTDTQTVEGWQCHAQPDATTPSICTKDGLVIGLRAN